MDTEGIALTPRRMVQPDDLSIFTQMPYLMNYEELAREAATVLIVEKGRIDIRKMFFRNPYSKIK